MHYWTDEGRFASRNTKMINVSMRRKIGYLARLGFGNFNDLASMPIPMIEALHEDCQDD